ncbi:MAG: leucine-rich repeat domain-containing protein [Gemmataceae bacterium]
MIQFLRTVVLGFVVLSAGYVFAGKLASPQAAQQGARQELKEDKRPGKKIEKKKADNGKKADTTTKKKSNDQRKKKADKKTEPRKGEKDKHLKKDTKQPIQKTVKTVNKSTSKTMSSTAAVARLRKLTKHDMARRIGVDKSRVENPIIKLNLTGFKLDGSVYPLLSSFRDLEVLYLSRTNVRDEYLKSVAGLPKLKTLLLSGTSITPKGLQHLESLETLERLDLSKTQVESLKGLSKFTNLRHIGLDKTSLPDEALGVLGQLKELTLVSISDVKTAGDDGIAHVSQLPKLHQLYCRNTKLSDGGLKKLSKCQSLMALDLAGTKITDKGLADLANLPKLRYLDLSDTKITDDGLKKLAKLKALRTLELRNIDGITAAGVAELRQTLDRCSVSANPNK